MEMRRLHSVGILDTALVPSIIILCAHSALLSDLSELFKIKEQHITIFISPVSYTDPGYTYNCCSAGSLCSVTKVGAEDVSDISYYLNTVT